jgi:hypothetical protein
MSFTRKFLLNLFKENAIEAPTDVINAIINEYVHTRDDLIEKKVDEVKKEYEENNDGSSEDYKKKYEDEHKAFEDFKTNLENEKAFEKRSNAYKKLLEDAHIDPKRIDTVLRVSKDTIDKLEFDEKDGVKDADKLKETIGKEWADFQINEEVEGTPTPQPGNAGGNESGTNDLESMSMEDFIKARKGV